MMFIVGWQKSELGRPRRYGPCIIFNHACQVFFSRRAVLPACVEAAAAVARPQVERADAESLRNHPGNPLVDFGNLHFCRPWRVYGRGVEARMDTDISGA